MKKLITPEPYGIFGLNFAYLFILILSSHWYANNEEASPNIISAGRGLLVKILITVYFDQILHAYTLYHCLDTGMQNGEHQSVRP